MSELTRSVYNSEGKFHSSLLQDYSVCLNL
jgi:hypothetical protein